MIRTRVKFVFVAGLMLLATMFVCPKSFAASTYTIEDITDSYTSGTISTLSAINNSGTVVGAATTSGWWSSYENAVIYSNGSTTDIYTAVSNSLFDSVANDINSGGSIATTATYYGYGTSESGGYGTTGAYVTDSSGTTYLGTLGGTDSGAVGINDAGVIVGWADTSSNSTHAFMYVNGTMVDLGTLGGSDSVANAINSSGVVTGSSDVVTTVNNGGNNTQQGHGHGQGSGSSNWTTETNTHAFLYADGVMTDLGTLGGDNSYGIDINDSGQVVGYSDVSNTEQHAFLYDGGTMIDLGTLGGSTSQALGINESGTVVGWSTDSSGSSTAFVYLDGTMIDLNTLLSDSITGWDLQYAYAINDSGQIIGFGTYNGQVRAFLLTPVPEAGEWAMIFLGLGCVAYYARRKKMALQLAS